MRRQSRFVIVAAALGLAACSESAGPASLSDADAELVAESVDALVLDVLDQMLLGGAFGVDGPQPAEPRTSTYSHGRSAACPAGGSISISIAGTRTFDRDAGTVDDVNEGTKSFADCARTRGDRTVTLNGGGTLTHERHWAGGAPAGVWVTTNAGEVAWSTSDGRSGSCAHALTSTIDTAARTVTVTGTNCGREVNWSRTWR